MDTMQAFMMGEANRGAPRKVFDWDRAATIIKDRNASAADAGLEGDWECTGGAIWRDGGVVPADDTYTYLASTWASPLLLVDGESVECWRYEEQTPGWTAETYWPDSARTIAGVQVVNDVAPRKGDRVKVTFEAVYDHPDFDWDIYDVGSGCTTSVLRKGATVEVIERADDPRKDVIHTSRRRPGLVDATRDDSVAVKFAPDCWITSGDGATYFVLPDEAVIGWPVFGVVPGSPAAEAEQAAAHPCTLAADCPAKGHNFECHSLDDTPFDEQRKALPCPVTPRLYSAADDEPPLDVSVLEWLHPAAGQIRYLWRVEGGWSWATGCSEAAVVDSMVMPWADLAGLGEFREVPR